MANSEKKLRQNPYTTYRDPQTGLWIVVKPDEGAERKVAQVPAQPDLSLEDISALEVGFPLAHACRLHERVKKSNAGFYIKFLKSIVYFNQFRPLEEPDKLTTDKRYQLIRLIKKFFIKNKSSRCPRNRLGLLGDFRRSQKRFVLSSKSGNTFAETQAQQVPGRYFSLRDPQMDRLSPQKVGQKPCRLKSRSWRPRWRKSKC